MKKKSGRASASGTKKAARSTTTRSRAPKAAAPRVAAPKAAPRAVRARALDAQTGHVGAVCAQAVRPEALERAPGNLKAADLAIEREDSAGTQLTTNQGLLLENDQDSLKAGDRGPSLLEDFHFREKITHFDHERIPERVVHARGSAAHGYFQVYENLEDLTMAGFLQDPALRTPVFVRFSTVAGSRGSTDLARDVRGFAVKFYTEEGNFDLVGNNMPVFFIQDAMKFPDLVHAVKPEPDHEMPQAASAHDTFWDFISLMPESMHMIMWTMSDRAIPRSFRMMEGFGVHTFRLVNAAGKSRFVKFHWKPLLGVHSVAWDEAQKISGKDPDFLRRDLWEAIASGNPAEWELGLQIVEEKDEHKFDFDLLDPTKIIPEELVPVRRVGRLTLNRNPDNFFAETEQVAFHPGHLVPGIDFSNDPLLQGRLFSYTDTQLLRLGGPNFHELPINRPIVQVHNNQRDGFSRQMINRSKTSYEPNSIGGGCPMQTGGRAGGFVSFPQAVSGPKVRARSEKFFDHFSQAALFYNSQSEPEQDHIVEALRFELGKVERIAIRERMLGLLGKVDTTLATRVAEGLGLPASPKLELPLNRSIGADADVADRESLPRASKVGKSPALSMANTLKDSIATRKVAILAADGVDDASVVLIKQALADAGAQGKIVAPRLGFLKGAGGQEFLIEFSLLTASSVLFDAVIVPGGERSIAALSNERDAIEFVTDAYRHCKTIGALGAGGEFLRACPGLARLENGTGKAKGPFEGIVVGADAGASAWVRELIELLAKHRHWTRRDKNRAGLTRDADDTRGRAPRS
jgi:catalase